MLFWKRDARVVIIRGLVSGVWWFVVVVVVAVAVAVVVVSCVKVFQFFWDCCVLDGSE